MLVVWCFFNAVLLFIWWSWMVLDCFWLFLTVFECFICSLWLLIVYIVLFHIFVVSCFRLCSFYCCRSFLFVFNDCLMLLLMVARCVLMCWCVYSFVFLLYSAVFRFNAFRCFIDDSALSCLMCLLVCWHYFVCLMCFFCIFDCC